MSVTTAKGFVASGVAAGIRRRDRKDLAVVRSLVPATGAAMFTRNRVQAACLTVNRDNLALAQPQAVVINSGVANAATGERGKLDALATAIISHLVPPAIERRLLGGGVPFLPRHIGLIDGLLAGHDARRSRCQ